MEALLGFWFIAFLIFELVAGLRMGRHMTFLFKELKEQDPELWRDLAQPNALSMFDVAGYMRGTQIMFRGNVQLATHPTLSRHYHLARKWYLISQFGGALLVFMFIILALSNAL